MNARISPAPSHLSSRFAPELGRVLAFEPTHGRRGRPRLECGIAPALNEHVERAHRHTLDWAVQMGLVEGHGRKFARFGAARFTWLAARAYPLVDASALELISDWITFLFFYDDMCDTQESTDPNYLEKLMVAEDRLIEIGYGAPAREGDTPLDLALVDIHARARALAGRHWLARLGAHVQEYIEGVRWERSIRLQGSIPSLATYAKLRLLISAVFPCFDFAGMFVDGQRSDFTRDPLVQQLEVMATNHICWVNDIYGLDKELREDTTSNIVIVLANEFDLSWDEALDRAIEMSNAELRAFEELEAELAASRPADPAREAYVAGLRSWMRGNLDWYSETKRYCGDAEDTLSACWSAWTEWQSVA